MNSCKPWVTSKRQSLICEQLESRLMLASNAPDSSSETQVASFWYSGVDTAFLSARVEQGARITDVEVESASPLRLAATAVLNRGAYQKQFWWYVNLTSQQVNQKIGEHNARITDLEPYVANGQQRFTVLLEPNTGPNRVDWWWYFGLSRDGLGTRLSENEARLSDIETYEDRNGESKYAAVMVGNSGELRREWSWTPPLPIRHMRRTIDLSPNRRVVDMEVNSAGNFSVIFEESVDPPDWWWTAGATSETVSALAISNKARIFDIESYISDGERRYAAVLINNSVAPSPGSPFVPADPPFPFEPVVPIDPVDPPPEDKFPGDIDCDSCVTFTDFLFLASEFGQTGDLASDVNGDNVVNFLDFLIVSQNFGKCKPIFVVNDRPVLDGGSLPVVVSPINSLDVVQTPVAQNHDFVFGLSFPGR